MKLETFFKKFDQFADAPDAVAKMRELIIPQSRGDAENPISFPPRLAASRATAANLLSALVAELTGTDSRLARLS